uniref:Uncharacterized protein n=1 Tax=Compsopogon caeruleus TaxID=31354 RepID=A0A7S1TFW3_9RHOD|mmetsp:Transcript_430/g.771  ORF Transcript_430/g.771 Transcript_430/m.771 type:complete len:246 (+) Transcript_430:104-841(+)
MDQRLRRMVLGVHGFAELTIGKFLLPLSLSRFKPLDSLDPLGLTNTDNHFQYQTMGEWEAHCDVTGRAGMPSFQIRPKTFSRHGRQYVKTSDGHYFFSIAKQGKLHTMSVLPHYEVCRGDDNDAEVYTIVGDLMERTMQIKNDKDETIAMVQKSLTALILSQTLGGGSEMLIDIAPGVDCSAILAIVLAMKQVGAHYAKDAIGNFVLNPLQDSVVDSAMEQTGSIGSTITGLADKAVRFGRLFQQ